MTRAVGYSSKIPGLLAGLAVVLAGALFPSPAAAQVVDTSEPCNGDQDHHSHGWPGHSCNLYWNPHYSRDVLAGGCHQRAKHCAACYECCDKQFNETKKCECVFFPPGSGREQCEDLAEQTRDHACKLTACVGEFLDGCEGLE